MERGVLGGARLAVHSPSSRPRSCGGPHGPQESLPSNAVDVNLHIRSDRLRCKPKVHAMSHPGRGPDASNELSLSIRVARGEAEVSWGGGSIPRRGRVRVPPWWETPADNSGLPATLDTVTGADSSRYCATASPEGSENSSYFHVAENVTRRF